MNLFAIKRKRFNSVLIIKIGGIGDIVMTLPMLSYIQATTHITWVVGKNSAPVLTMIPQIQTIIVVNEQQLLYGSAFQKIKNTLSIWKQLYFKGFDRILVLHTDKRYHLLHALSFGKKVSSFAGTPYKMVPFRYHAYEYIRLFTKETLQSKSLIWPKINIPICSVNNSYDVILAPGGNPAVEPGKELRQWPAHYYRELADLLKKMKKKVAIIGGPSDRWLYNYFDEKMADLFIDNFSIPEVVSFFKQSKILVTHDSGPMHLGILSNIHVIALFGPTIPNEKLPEGVTMFWGGEKLACRPCYNGKRYASCNNPLCMKEIKPIAVLQTIQKILI